MLVTQKVALIDECVEPIDTADTKTIRLSLGENQVFVLAVDRGDAVPVILRVFTLNEFSVVGSVFRWVITDDQGRTFDGRHQPITLRPDWLEIHPVFPLVITQGDHGLRAAFEFTLPKGCRIHLLHYLKRKWPEVVKGGY